MAGLTWDPKLPSFTSSTSNDFNKSKLPHVPDSAALYKSNSQLVDGLLLPPNDPKKLNILKKQHNDSAGKNWFDMPSPTLTPEIKNDLQLLKLRSAIDPKRHYKKASSKSNKALPKYFQVGTVIEPATEFYTARLTKKERKASLADELLSDAALCHYRKRKVREIEEKNKPGGVDKWKTRGQQSRKRAKERRH